MRTNSVIYKNYIEMTEEIKTNLGISFLLPMGKYGKLGGDYKTPFVAATRCLLFFPIQHKGSLMCKWHGTFQRQHHYGTNTVAC
jgi:hypothetical protein